LSESYFRSIRVTAESIPGSERFENPKTDSDKLSGSKNRDKIKLRAAGFRLVYEAIDKDIVVPVIAVGKRERNKVYKIAVKRDLPEEPLH